MAQQSHLITNQTFLPALEGWRGIVSVFVMLFHFYMFFADTLFIPYAFLGVDFFFILSGFIITRQYEASIGTRSTNFKVFAIRRLARLWPLYIFSIALFLLVNHFYIEPNNSDIKAVDVGMGPRFFWHTLLQLTMLSNIGGMPMPWNGPAWSVSVEWIVNLAFFAMAWQLRRIPTLLWFVIAAFCAVYLVDYSPKSMNLIFAEPALFNPTLARGFLGFALGAMIFRMHHSLPRLSWFALHAIDVLLVLAIALILAYYGMEFVVSLDYVFVILLFPPIIIVSLYKKSWIGRIAALPPFLFLGKISYSIYLLHLPLGYFYQYSPMIRELDLIRPLYGLFYIVLVIIISTLCYVFLEKPCRYIGRRVSQRYKKT